MTFPSETKEYSGRLLIKKGEERLLYKKGKLILECGKRRDVYNLAPLSTGVKRVGLKIRCLDRLLRLEPRCACCVNDGYLVSWQGKVLKLQENGTIEVEHIYRQGMNNPISLVNIVGIPDFDDGLVYGEYWGNLPREPVAVWARSSGGNWGKKYEFPAGSIQHIHGILPDRINNRVLILTGDRNEESCIWEAREDFTVVKKLIGGSQKYRSCVAFLDGNDVLYATDTPLEQNYVYRYRTDSNEVSEVMKLQGACVYGSAFTDRNGVKQYVFITTVEPDASIHGWRYRLTCKLGKGISDRYSYINMLSERGETRILMKTKKDLWPIWLFQFGNFRVAETDCGLAVTGQALEKYDERTIEFDL